MLHDGLERNINRREYEEYTKETSEGFNNIVGLQYTEDVTTFAPGSTIIDASYFSTGREEAVHLRKTHDLRNGSRPFAEKKRKVGMRLF